MPDIPAPAAKKNAVPRQYWLTLAAVTAVFLLLVCLIVSKLTGGPRTYEAVPLHADEDYTLRYEEYSQGLLPFYTYNEKGAVYGCIDLEGNVVVEPVYDALGIYNDGYTYATLDRKDGLLDLKGNTVLDFAYDAMMGCDDGIVTAIVLKGEEYTPYTLAMKTDGTLLWEIEGEADFFRDGMSRYIRPDATNVGFINDKGEEVIEPIYSAASHFADGVAVVRVKNAPDLTVIDKKGNTVFTIPGKTKPVAYSDGLCRIQNVSAEKGENGTLYDYYYYDTKGNTPVTVGGAYYASDFYGGMAAVVLPGEDGSYDLYAMDKKGNLTAIEGEYESVTYAGGVIFARYTDPGTEESVCDVIRICD